jgi:hypothetical protein
MLYTRFFTLPTSYEREAKWQRQLNVQNGVNGPENEPELKAHSRSKIPVPEVSKLTKLIVGALRQKALEMGMSLGHRR